MRSLQNMNADITRFVRSLNHPHIMKMHEVYFEQAGLHHVLAKKTGPFSTDLINSASRQMGVSQLCCEVNACIEGSQGVFGLFGDTMAPNRD